MVTGGGHLHIVFSKIFVEHGACLGVTPPWVPTSWFVFLFAVHIVLPSAYLKEFGDYSRGMQRALNLKRSLDKATPPQMFAILSAQKNTQTVWATKRKEQTSQELTEVENEKPLAKNTVTASKHRKKPCQNQYNANTSCEPAQNHHNQSSPISIQYLLLGRTEGTQNRSYKMEICTLLQAA